MMPSSERFMALMGTLKVGDPLDESTSLGALGL